MKTKSISNNISLSSIRKSHGYSIGKASRLTGINRLKLLLAEWNIRILTTKEILRLFNIYHLDYDDAHFF